MEYILILLKHKLKDYWIDKLDIFAGTLSAGAYTIATIITFDVIFKNTDNVGGLSKDYFILLYAFSEIVVGIIGTFITPFGMELYEQYITLNLDLVLTKPISILKYLTFVECDFGGLPVIFIGFILLATIHISTNIFNILIGSVLLIFGVIMILAVFVSFASISCLIHSESLTVFFMKTSDVFRYPLTLFPKLIQMMLIYIIPVGLVCYVPVRAVQGSLDPLLVIQFLFVFILNLFISRFLFKYIIHKYQNN